MYIYIDVDIDVLVTKYIPKGSIDTDAKEKGQVKLYDLGTLPFLFIAETNKVRT